MKQLLFIILFSWVSGHMLFSQLIADHTCTDITAIPEEVIIAAKDSLHIAYGHTSHGSQVTEGMSGLIDFANGGGRGLSLPQDIFNWNNGGENDALDLHDYAMSGDVGYYPDWYSETVSYLEDEANADVNVIMWSWCGQVGSKYENGLLWDEYFGPMSLLETTYPEITFVYMTGHLDYWNRVNTNAANDSIRSFCRNNGKVLFDFADIESYSPDGTDYKNNADDACNYYNTGGDSIGNWALEYENSHTEGVDWYTCGSQHTQPFNANLKAYAAWWLFASLGGWNYTPPPVVIDGNKTIMNCTLYPNPSNTETTVTLNAPVSQLLCVDLLTINGQYIRTCRNFSDTNGSSRISVSTSDLQPGVYLLRVVSENGTLSQPLHVVH
jgi:hypothetical protein